MIDQQRKPGDAAETHIVTGAALIERRPLHSSEISDMRRLGPCSDACAISGEYRLYGQGIDVDYEVEVRHGDASILMYGPSIGSLDTWPQAAANMHREA